MDLGYIEMPGRFSRFRWQTSGSYVWRPQCSPFFPKGVEASTVVCFGHLFFGKPIWKTNEFLEKCWCMPLLLCPKDHITGTTWLIPNSAGFQRSICWSFHNNVFKELWWAHSQVASYTWFHISIDLYICKMSHNLHYGSSANMRYSAYTLHLDRIGYTSS